MEQNRSSACKRFDKPYLFYFTLNMRIYARMCPMSQHKFPGNYDKTSAIMVCMCRDRYFPHLLPPRGMTIILGNSILFPGEWAAFSPFLKPT